MAPLSFFSLIQIYRGHEHDVDSRGLGADSPGTCALRCDSSCTSQRVNSCTGLMPTSNIYTMRPGGVGRSLEELESFKYPLAGL